MVLEGFDHALLFLSTEKTPEWMGRKFMYDDRWSRMQECRDLVSEEWRNASNGSHAFRFCEKMKSLRRRVKVWYRGNGRNSKKMIQKLKEEIRGVYCSNGFASDEVK